MFLIFSYIQWLNILLVYPETHAVFINNIGTAWAKKFCISNIPCHVTMICPRFHGQFKRLI